MQGTPEDDFTEDVTDLYENSPCGYLSILPDGTIVKVNQTLLSWLGYSSPEILGRRRLQDLLSIGSQIFYETHLHPLFQMQNALTEISLELRTRERKLIPVLMTMERHQNSSGTLHWNRVTFFNITDRKKFEQELMLARKKADQAAQAKADFLSMMSHEIRTPLNAIVGITHLLKDTPLSVEQQEHLHLLSLSSEHLLQLINDILDFNRIEAGKITLDEKGCDLRQLLSRTVQALSSKSAQKGVELLMEVGPEVPPYVELDAMKITQVLTNLLGNAIKFTAFGRVILRVKALEIQPETVSLQISVADTGIGIPEERLPFIFEEFTQAHSGITSQYGGSGLGLAICQKLLALYASKLEVTSRLGEGSIFSFQLQLKTTDGVDSTGEPLGADHDQDLLKGLRILVAEDNASNVYVLSRFLKKWGIVFDVVTNGRDATQRAASHSYDLLLMDLQMPQLDGYQAAQLIRTHAAESVRNIPILALSASTRFGSKEYMDSSQFNGFVGKPFRPEELFHKIAHHSGRLLANPNDKQQRKPSLPPPRAPKTEAPRFSLQLYLEAIEFEDEALRELGPISIESFQTAREEIRVALQTHQSEAFEFHIHKVSMVLELLQAEGIREAFAQCRHYLNAEAQDAAALPALLQHLDREIEAVIEALQKAVQAAGGTPGSDSGLL